MILIGPGQAYYRTKLTFVYELVDPDSGGVRPTQPPTGALSGFGRGLHHHHAIMAMAVYVGPTVRLGGP